MTVVERKQKELRQDRTPIPQRNLQQNKSLISLKIYWSNIKMNKVFFLGGLLLFFLYIHFHLWYSSSKNVKLDMLRRRILMRNSFSNVRSGAKNVLIVALNTHFIGDLVQFIQKEHPQYNLKVHDWKNDIFHFDRNKLEQDIAAADIIFAEWCHSNAVIVSKKARPGQKVLVRLHRYEMTTPWVKGVVWKNVDDFIFIAPHVRDQTVELLNFKSRPPTMKPRFHVIYNTFNVSDFRRGAAKNSEAQWTLGLAGYIPKLKGINLAIDILQMLDKRQPNRWNLRIIGSSWRSSKSVMKKPQERSYYEEMERHITDVGLSKRIHFDGFVDDVANWHKRIGFILSTSVMEGSHQAIAQGMAAGSVPIVRNWTGAEKMYPSALHFSSVQEAVELIRRKQRMMIRDHSTFLNYKLNLMEEALERFSPSVVMAQFDKIMLQ